MVPIENHVARATCKGTFVVQQISLLKLQTCIHYDFGPRQCLAMPVSSFVHIDEVHIDFFAHPTYVTRPYALSCTSLGPLPLWWLLSKPSDHFQAAYQVFHLIQVCHDMVCTTWFL